MYCMCGEGWENAKDELEVLLSWGRRYTGDRARLTKMENWKTTGPWEDHRPESDEVYAEYRRHLAEGVHDLTSWGLMDEKSNEFVERMKIRDPVFAELLRCKDIGSDKKHLILAATRATMAEMMKMK
ncbi:hypothetical protein GQ42DRAFT_153453 [Ramicandelaber brevisporus]|nr:hypothetical protein GQ42DRAFT_153453 [Ramicandelaber brevisporus]